MKTNTTLRVEIQKRTPQYNSNSLKCKKKKTERFKIVEQLIPKNMISFLIIRQNIKIIKNIAGRNPEATRSVKTSGTKP